MRANSDEGAREKNPVGSSHHGTPILAPGRLKREGFPRGTGRESGDKGLRDVGRILSPAVDTPTSVAYGLQMIEVRGPRTFSAWLSGLKDARAKADVARRVRRLALSTPGDVRPVGDGVSELRIHHGPGYRVYDVQRGRAIMHELTDTVPDGKIFFIKLARAASSWRMRHRRSALPWQYGAVPGISRQ